MAGTNAAAFIRLKPLENTNTGQIVEEHIRYWRRRNDEEEAQRRAQKARQKEFERKVAKQTFETVEGLQPEESEGFLIAQIMDTFEKKKGYLTDLAINSARGDMDSTIKLADEKRKLTNLLKANTVYSEKFKALEEQKAKGEFNEILDTDLDRMKNSFLQSKYKVNPDWSIDVYNPTKDGFDRIGSSNLLNNEILNSQFNKKANFIENGQTIAKNLLDNLDGDELITPQTKIEGVRLVRGLLDQDVVEAASWLGSARSQGILDGNKPLSELTNTEKNRLAETYYDNLVLPNIQEVDKDTTLDDALKQQRLANLRKESKLKDQRLTKGDRDLKDTTVSLSVATNEDGETIKADLREGDKDFFQTAVQNGTILNIVGTNTRREVKDEKDTSVTYTHLIQDDATGDITAIGKYVTEVPILDEDGEPTGETREEVQMRIVDNDTELNTISSMFDGVTNLKQLSDKVNETIGSNPEPKKKEEKKKLTAEEIRSRFKVD